MKSGNTSRLAHGKKKQGKGHDENHIDCGRRAGREIRAAAGAGRKISNRGGGFGGSGDGGTATGAAGSGAAGRGAAGPGWTVVSAVDARTGKRDSRADGFGAGHGKDGSGSAAAWCRGLSGEGIRIGGIAATGCESFEAGDAGKRK